MQKEGPSGLACVGTARPYPADALSLLSLIALFLMRMQGICTVSGLSPALCRPAAFQSQSEFCSDLGNHEWHSGLTGSVSASLSFSKITPTAPASAAYFALVRKSTSPRAIIATFPRTLFLIGPSASGGCARAAVNTERVNQRKTTTSKCTRRKWD